MAANLRRLEWSAGARSDLLAIDARYARLGEGTGKRAIRSIVPTANTLRQYPFSSPKGVRPGTRHRAVEAYPYTLVYRVTARAVRLVRVLDQRRTYFQRALRGQMAEYAVKPKGRRRT